MDELFWNASVEELKRGYIVKDNAYVCLLCGERFEKGIIYTHEGTFYDAERFTRVHIETTHDSIFDYLIGLDKKLTGLTDHQNQLLRLFYQGKSDKEVQETMKIGSINTIRHHRFALKEKERHARLFLTMMELLREKDQYAPAFVPPHKTAKMVDDRYDVTREEQAEIVKKFFTDDPEKRLRKFPPKEKQRLIVLREMTKRIDSEQIYSEKEFNQILQAICDDYVMIRRYLIEYGFVDRTPDGSAYWLKK